MSQLDNFRTINIDRLDPESSANFPMETLLPATLPPPETSSDAANVATQVRQLLRGGDSEGALRHVLDTAPLGGDDRAKEVHLATVIEVLQGIRQGEMTRVLEGVCAGDGGSERADCLMKYLYVTSLYLEGSFGESMLTRYATATRECPRLPPVAELSRRATCPSHRRVPAGSHRSRGGIWAKVAVDSR